MNGNDFIYYIIGLIVLYAFGSVVYDRITGNDPGSVARREYLAAEQAQQTAHAKKEFEPSSPEVNASETCIYFWR